MAIDWKKAGLASLNPLAAAKVQALKSVSGGKGSVLKKDEGGFGDDPTSKDSRLEQRRSRAADKGRGWAMRKEAQKAAYDRMQEGYAVTPEERAATMHPYLESLSAAEQAAVSELAGPEGAMQPASAQAAAAKGIMEGTQEQRVAGTAALEEQLLKDKSAKQAQDEAILRSTGKEDEATMIALSSAAAKAFQEGDLGSHIQGK